MGMEVFGKRPDARVGEYAAYATDRVRIRACPDRNQRLQ